MFFFNPNNLIWFLGNNLVRIYNPISRKNIIVSSDFINLISCIINKGTDEKMVLNKKERFRFIDATNFNLWDCMYNNPNQFDKTKLLDKIPSLSAKEVLDYLIKINFISDENIFNTDFKKSSPFDRYKGNINEQIATESLYRRSSISKWWVKQKFETEEKENTKNLYKYVQDSFLKNYFSNYLKGKKVLEIGCGTGYYCKKMSKYASEVVGIDYEEEYINLAIKNINSFSNIKFLIKDIADPKVVKSFSKEEFDFIFMIDIFLFLFDEKFQIELFKNKKIILSNISKLLHKNGRIVIMDPHLFWLSAREGNSKNPIAIMTEYKNRKFSSIPPLEEYSQLFFDSGFLVRKIFEPKCDISYKEINDFDYEFSNEFPQWIVWELVKK